VIDPVLAESAKVPQIDPIIWSHSPPPNLFDGEEFGLVRARVPCLLEIKSVGTRARRGVSNWDLPRPRFRRSLRGHWRTNSGLCPTRTQGYRAEYHAMGVICIQGKPTPSIATSRGLVNEGSRGRAAENGWHGFYEQTRSGLISAVLNLVNFIVRRWQAQGHHGRH